MRSCPRSAEHGFTLVELMVALVLFGLIAAAGVSLLAFSVRTQAAAGARLDDIGAMRRLSALLSADLAQVLPRTVRDGQGHSLRAFEGHDGRQPGVLMAYARGGWSNPDSAPRGSIQRVDVLLDHGALQRRTYPMADGAEANAPSALLTNIEWVSLRYRSAREWRGQWDDTRLDALPRAVELTVKRTGRPALMMAFLTGTQAP